MTRLNPRQQEAVRYIDGPLLVLAGAGSGKTSVITRKIAYLVEQCGIDAGRVAAVTFTNKAAREMRERVGKLLGERGKDLAVGTFHQLGLRIIREEIQTLAMRRGFSILDGQDVEQVLRDILRQEHVDAAQHAAIVQHRVSAWKNACMLPDAAWQAARTPMDKLAAGCYERYQRTLQLCNAVDFDDLILKPTQLFASAPEILERWQNRIHYLLVDEYQDTNAAQYLMVRQLVGLRGQLTAVGDDDQSIYGWRGAQPENLTLLQRDYPGLKLVKLEQNYRSTGRILRAANTLISNNPHEFSKELWSELGPGDRLRVIGCANEQDETDQIVAELQAHRLRHSSRLGDYAILYRGNHQARLLEIALQREQLSYQISGGTSFFSRNEIKDVMAYLRLLINPRDDGAFLRIANVPRRKLGSTTLLALGEFAAGRQLPLAEAARQIDAQAIGGAGLAALQRFVNLLDTARRACDTDPIEGVRTLLQGIDYEAWLRVNSSSEEVARRRMDNVDLLLHSVQRALGTGGHTLTDAVAQLQLQDRLEQQGDDRNAADCVQLMTLHAAKGLEFPCVFMVGLEENLLPHRSSIESGDLAEERRLAYVGITRAQRTLTLSYAQQRRHLGRIIECTPSRFLDELPIDDLIWHGRNSEEAGKERAAETLATLKALLG